MKKIISAILSVAIIVTMLSALPVFSDDNEIKVELDGVEIEFDVKPEVINGRTMVPLRKIFEEIGALVKWDNDTQTVSARKSSKTITLAVDSNELNIDKGKTDEEGNPIIETVALDVPAKIVSGRTLVPARAISESFGLNVDWDEKNNKVVITSDKNEDDSWKENIGSINLTNLTFKGDGIEIKGNQISITKGGDFTLTGKLANGNITVSTKEKVKLRLSGASIVSKENSCIFVEDADKAYITLTEGTVNTLTAENSEDGAIYSKENLEIKGNGALSINSKAGHGIKASDNLTIENGDITIDATYDGIHINDTFKMTGGNVNITSIGDGIDSESIVNISGGKIDIETDATPIPQTTSNQDNKAPENTNTNRFPMMEADTEVEFEKSSKGINAEWMMCIYDGEISVNSASHGIHCEDEIVISGGTFDISSKYEKGISAHGNLTIDGSETLIDITKSTEGIESKNVMTINDGIISVVSSDDALNATGGKSGAMMGMGQNGGNKENAGNRTPGEGANTRPGRENGQFGGMKPPFEIPQDGQFTPPTGNMPQMGGNMGGIGKNMKDCLIINGGSIELYAEDDCIDSNGNLIINGGTIKATNPTGSFSGAFGVIDPDGQTTISEKANLIFASGSGNERSLKLSQNTIIVYTEATKDKNEEITVSDADGKVIYQYTPIGKFGAVLISSNDLILGKTYTVTIGQEKFETKLTNQTTVIGTQTTGNKGFGRQPGMQ